MWTLAVLVLGLTAVVLSLDSNEIRSSREIITHSEPTLVPATKQTVNLGVLNNVRERQKTSVCTNRRRNKCQETKRRRVHKTKPTLDDPVTEKGSRRRNCVRSRDCGEGWCCVQYTGERRCQRVLQEGEMCLLGGRPKSKSHRRLERCDCTAGLNCFPMPSSRKGQGECRVHENTPELD